MEEFSQFWFDVSLQGIAVVEPVHADQSGEQALRYVLVNTAFVTIVRQTKDDLTGQLITGLFQHQPDTVFVNQLLRTLQTGESQQFHLQGHYAGDPVWVQVAISRMNRQLMVTIQDISEQKKSQHELQRRLAMESILSAVSSRMITLKSYEMDSYFTEALEQIGTYIRAERAAVVIYSGAYQYATCTYEWCAPGIESRKAANRQVPISSFSWMHQRLEAGQLVQFNTREMTPDAVNDQNIMDSMAVRSVVAVPLVRERKTQGFIGFYTITHTQVWDHHEVSFLATCSALIISVYERIRQETDIRRANQRLEGLREIDQALLSYRLADKSPLLIAMKYVHFMVPCERITVFQIEEETQLAVARCRLINGVPEKNPRQVITDLCFYEHFLSGDKITHFADIKQSMPGGSTKLKDSLHQEGFQSLVIVPLFNRQECIGVFTLASAIPNFFTEEHLQIVGEMASQLTIVLHQQQLDEQLDEYTGQLEQRVDERTREVRQLSTVQRAILQHASQAIMSTDINGVIQTANPACEKLIGYRPDELLGRVAHLESGSGDNPVPIITYIPVKRGRKRSDRLLDLLAEQGYFQTECLLIRKDGSLVPVLMASSVLTDENNLIIGYVGLATDISALKSVESKLQEKNQELNTIFEGAIDLHCIVTVEGVFLATNRSWEMTLGYTRQDLNQLTFSQLVHPEEQETLRQSLLTLTNNLPIRNKLNRFLKKDGTYRSLEWNAIRVNTSLYASARDVTERQQHEAQLTGLNQRLQLATRAAGQGIWEIDIKKDKLIWDGRLLEMHGLHPGRTDWSFRDFEQMIHPEDREAFIAVLKSNVISNVVARIILPDGTIRYMETSGTVITDENNEVVSAIGVVHDVTERKLAEEALRESERRFREIAENVDEVFWIHSAEPFELLYVNSAYERIWNNSCQRLYEDMYSFLDAILEEDKPLARAFLDQYRAGHEGQFYCRQKGTDEAIRWLSIRTFVVHDGYGKIVRHIGIANDVTGQKEKEAVLQQSLQREQELNQLKSQFVATASHEFRTPLTSIQSSVDLIKFYLDLPTPKAGQSIRHHLAVIDKEIDQFGILLSDILTIGTIEAGKVKFTPRLASIEAVCREIVSTHFSKQADHRSVELSIKGTPFPLSIDEKLISHVIVNLLSNAFKFSAVNPELRLIYKDAAVIIQVVDKGVGIPARDIPALFQAFFRASNSGGIPGTGLGLVIARQFVELHGGYLDIQSEEKKGTTCTVTLPLNQTMRTSSNDTLATLLFN